MSNGGAMESRGATPEGSRGLQSTEAVPRMSLRRGATREDKSRTCESLDGAGFGRRYATRALSGAPNHGLKPMATFVAPLRGALKPRHNHPSGHLNLLLVLCGLWFFAGCAV